MSAVLSILVIAFAVERWGPSLLRHWWLYQIHWNSDRTMCWSTMSASQVEELTRRRAG